MRTAYTCTELFVYRCVTHWHAHEQDAAAKAAALALADSGPRAAGVTLKGKAGVQGVNMDHYNVQTGKVHFYCYLSYRCTNSMHGSAT
jgi:hypothetical protein